MSDFSQPLAFLDRLSALVKAGAAAGLRSATPGVHAALLAVAHSKIAGQTGATFAGLVVYVAGEGVADDGAFDAAVAAVAGLNPRHVAVESIDPGGGPHDIHVIATVPTDYQNLLETLLAAEKGFLTELDGHAGALGDAAARGIAEVLG